MIEDEEWNREFLFLHIGALLLYLYTAVHRNLRLLEILNINATSQDFVYEVLTFDYAYK